MVCDPKGGEWLMDYECLCVCSRQCLCVTMSVCGGSETAVIWCVCQRMWLRLRV